MLSFKILTFLLNITITPKKNRVLLFLKLNNAIFAIY